MLSTPRSWIHCDLGRSVASPSYLSIRVRQNHGLHASANTGSPMPVCPALEESTCSEINAMHLDVEIDQE